MTEIMPFPENNNETVLLDRPFGVDFLCLSEEWREIPGFRCASLRMTGQPECPVRRYHFLWLVLTHTASIAIERARPKRAIAKVGMKEPLRS